MKFGNVFTEFCGHIPVFVKIHDNGPEYLEVPADIHKLPIEYCSLLAKYLSERNLFKKKLY
jgi:hypothetical protein